VTAPTPCQRRGLRLSLGRVAPLLEMVGVAKRFGATCAVEDLSLEVAAGEVLGLLGPNGAGKSTTLRMIASLVRPDRGQIRIGGHDLARDRLRALAEAGFLVEGPAMPPELTVRKALRYLALLDGGVAAGRIDDALGQLGLTELAGTRVKHLSLGGKQRLGIAAALLRRPPLLVLDEPMNGLDPAGIRDVGELLRGMAAAGAAVLVSSHLLDEVERIAHRVAVMARGKVAAVEPVSADGAGALARRFFAIVEGDRQDRHEDGHEEGRQEGPPS
jgi:ABC-2 type transport system ATP-binding protein